MRTPKFISPSSLARWEDRREEFYIMYLSDVRTPRDPQQNYMAAGSAFDAFVKSQIHTDVHGEAQTKGGQFDRNKLFEDQVEEHIRDEVWEMAEFFGSSTRSREPTPSCWPISWRAPYAPENGIQGREGNQRGAYHWASLTFGTSQRICSRHRGLEGQRIVLKLWRVPGSGFKKSRFFLQERRAKDRDAQEVFAVNV